MEHSDVHPASCDCPEWTVGEEEWRRRGFDEMSSALQMDYVSISVQTQRQSVCVCVYGGVHVLDADGFKLLPLFSIRCEAVTSLICAAAAAMAVLMFWVNELSAPPPQG